MKFAQEEHTSIGRRLIDGLPLKTVGTIVFTIIGWHYAEVVANAKTEGKIDAVSSRLTQQNSDQETRLNILRESNQHKVDKDTYDRDMRNVFDSLNRIQVSIDSVHSTLEARPR